MNWRLREGQGEAIYHIGVEDCGHLRGLSIEEMTSSLKTLNDMALALGATTNVLRESVIVSEDCELNILPKTVAKILVRKIPEDQSNIELRVAVMGNENSGKSTLLGVLTQGELDDGRGMARLNMFRHLHEIQTGRTSSISQEIVGFDAQGRIINYQEGSPETICEMSSKVVTLIDLAGHLKYLRTTLHGITGYSPHYIFFVISAAQGFTKTTMEHITLAVALQVLDQE
jgi:GTPase